MNTIKDKLLNESPEIIQETLANLENTQLGELQNVLILLWQVHPDETIQTKAQELLTPLLDDNSKAEITGIFSIFKSIVEYFPWMGDYTDLQKSNYAKFKANKAPYEALLSNSAVLINYYLDLGRKLYMLFELPAEAQDCFEGITQANPKNEEAFYALARLAEHRMDTDKALEYYNQCLSNNPKHLYASLQLGMLKAQKMADYEGAMEHYNTVVEIDPYMTEIYVRMAEACYAMADKTRTLQFLEIALDINEFHEEALNLLGRIQWKEEENIEEAIETFQKGLDHKIHGDSGLLLSSLGELYSTHLSENEKARVFFEKALKAKPNQPATLLKLVALLESIFQDYGAISTAFETFLAVTKNNAAIYVEYADFLIKYMHDYEFAKVQLEKALIIDDANELGNKLARQIEGYVADADEHEDIPPNDFDTDLDDDDYDDDDFVGGGAAGDN